MSPLWPSSSSARILRPGHSTRTSAARSRLDRAAFCGTIAAFTGGLHGPSTMALLTPLTRDEVAPDLVSLWDECERVYPDFRHLWAPMAHSPIVLRHVWGQLPTSSARARSTRDTSRSRSSSSRTSRAATTV